MSKLDIKVILGTTREGRFGEKPARWICDFLEQDPRLSAELVDLRDFPLPLFDRPKSPMRVTDGDYGHPVANAFGKKMAEADGFVMTAAEYNHGYAASLKNALDWIYPEWVRKR
jgi:NAD(P)H-dependent FMN reductase